MSIPRNLGNFADNLTSTGTLNVGGIKATGTPSASTALLGNGSWGTAGAFVFISSQTVSSAVASVDFSNVLSSTYDDYVVYVSQVTASASNTALYLRLEKSGSFITTSTYIYQWVKGASTTVTTGGSATGSEIRFYQAPGTTTNAGGSILLLGVNSTLEDAPIHLIRVVQFLRV